MGQNHLHIAPCDTTAHRQFK